jgi:hypothetical protein
MNSLLVFKRKYYKVIEDFSKILYSIELSEEEIATHTDIHNKKLTNLLLELETNYNEQILTEDWVSLYLSLIDQISTTKNKTLILSGYQFFTQTANEAIADKMLSVFPVSRHVASAVFDIYNHALANDFETYKRISHYFYSDSKDSLSANDVSMLILSYKKAGKVLDHIASLVLDKKKINLDTTAGFKRLLSYENELPKKSSVMSLYSSYQNYLARLYMYEKLKKNNKELLSAIKNKFVIIFEKLIQYEPTFEEMTMPYLIELGLRKPLGK